MNAANLFSMGKLPKVKADSSTSASYLSVLMKAAVSRERGRHSILNSNIMSIIKTKGRVTLHSRT